MCVYFQQNKKRRGPKGKENVANLRSEFFFHMLRVFFLFTWSHLSGDDEIRVTSGRHGTVFVMSRALRPLISFLGRQSHQQSTPQPSVKDTEIRETNRLMLECIRKHFLFPPADRDMKIFI